MDKPQGTAVRLKVSSQVARILREESRDVRLSVARGELSLGGEDLLTALAFLVHGRDEELRKEALRTLAAIPSAVLLPVVADPELHSQLLDLVERTRGGDAAVMEALIANPSAAPATVARLAARAQGGLLSLIVEDARWRSEAQIVRALLANPHAERSLGGDGGGGEKEENISPAGGEGEKAATEGEDSELSGAEAGDTEELNASKYQQALQMQVADKIKYAFTGDKEWRTILLKDPNKLVSSAALKNPRITEGEVLAIAKNKSTNDELIRIITLNQEWIKNYEMQKALVYHPRTPLPKALRYMNVLTPKDLKHLAKSKGVNQVVVNNARRLLQAKDKSR